MDNITFENAELNDILTLVQDKLGELRGKDLIDDHYHQMTIESYAEIEWKILKMLEG